MESQDIPLVVTTLNPFGRINQQLRCFHAWRDLGFQVLTANVTEEANVLRSRGVPASAILILDENDTALATRGKPVPKVVPVIEKAARLAAGRSMILTNSDIYPAAKNTEFARYFLAQSPLLALTRDEARLLDHHSAASKHPYRGGLDVFAFRAEAIGGLLRTVRLFPVSKQMAFGVPGWDYLMGALVMASGGAVMDGRVLLHEYHPATYSAIDEDFGPYLPTLRVLGAVTDPDPPEAAAEFAALVEQHCKSFEAVSDLAHHLYYRRPPPVPTSERAVSICAEMRALAPFLRWRTNVAAMAALAEAHLGSDENAYFRSVGFFVDPQAVRHGFAENLVALLFHLKCRRDRRNPVITDYPPGNAHAAALALARNDNRFVERLAVVRLFTEELALFSIFNPRLYDYLALSCDNDEERVLVTAVAEEIGVASGRPQDNQIVPEGQSHAA